MENELPLQKEEQAKEQNPQVLNEIQIKNMESLMKLVTKEDFDKDGYLESYFGGFIPI